MTGGRLLWVVALGAVTLASAPASAQTRTGQDARVAALAARLDVLTRRLDSLRSSYDTVWVEGVGFVVTPEQRDRAERVGRLALEQLSRALGEEDRRLLDGWTFGGWVSQAWNRRWREETDDAAVAGAVFRAAGEDRLQSLAGPELRQWNRWWSPESADLHRAYLDLVTTPSRAATACFDGDIEECSRILGVEPVDDPWYRLLDADDRRTWVAHRLRWSPQDPIAAWRQARRQECAQSRADEACLELLRSISDGRPRLVSARTPRSVLLVARALGGGGTFTRLLADTTAPLEDRLAAAAGIPTDSLLRQWHARVLAAAPPPTAASPRTGWTSLLVALALSALSLRSTRWR